MRQTWQTGNRDLHKYCWDSSWSGIDAKTNDILTKKIERQKEIVMQRNGMEWISRETTNSKLSQRKKKDRPTYLSLGINAVYEREPRPLFFDSIERLSSWSLEQVVPVLELESKSAFNNRMKYNIRLI